MTAPERHFSSIGTNATKQHSECRPEAGDWIKTWFRTSTDAIYWLAGSYLLHIDISQFVSLFVNIWTYEWCFMYQRVIRKSYIFLKEIIYRLLQNIHILFFINKTKTCSKLKLTIWKIYLILCPGIFERIKLERKTVVFINTVLKLTVFVHCQIYCQ